MTSNKWVILLWVSLFFQQLMGQEHKYTNALVNETSPYLLQHAHNPVNWYAWNDETLALAKKENKLLLISIGYAACHWCHVMERESFEDPEVAALMNEHFINVKVDREERPDVDQVYMDAVQLITGSGGWPLNCVAMPDGRPIWGGTYFPKNQWMNILNQLVDRYQNEPEKINEFATKLTEGVQQSSLVVLNEDAASFTVEELDAAVTEWTAFMDTQNGGRTGAPKFPMPGNLKFLLRYAVQRNDGAMKDYVSTSLTKMAYGGLYDQIGGGFARYSVDDRWHIPHFEKMLYDNAQLVSLYSEAYMATGNPLYKKTVQETLEFVERELAHKSGAFFSSLDADSNNEAGELEEGAYYIWKKEELEKILGTDFDLFAAYYNVNEFGYWEKDHYHLIRNESDKDFARENGLSLGELEAKTTTWKSILLEQREKRDRPRLDDKILTSWNALMLKGYVDAYKAFNDPNYLRTAVKLASFIQNNMAKDDGGLFRNHKNGQSNLEGYLEDYATVADAYLGLYEVTLQEEWLQSAKQYIDYCFDYFYDDQSKMFFYTSSKSASLINRKIETDDNVIPSSNSIMANTLFRLGHYFDQKRYTDNAATMLNNVKKGALKYGSGASNWLQLYSNYLGDFYEIAIVGEKAHDKLKEIHTNYIPNKLIVGSTTDSQLPLLQYKYAEGETTIFVCIGGACKLPVEKSAEALGQIDTSF